MAISAMTIALDRSHYSRYEAPRAIVKATIGATGSAGDQATIVLQRSTLGAPIEVASQTITFSGSPITPIVVSFDLRTFVDADGFSTVRSGYRDESYWVLAKVGWNILASKAFTVTPITAEEMRSDYLKGLPLTAAEQLMVRLQPQAITGVTVRQVSPTSARGKGTLSFTAPSTIEWANGGAITLITGVTSYLLPDAASGYILVDVDQSALPGSSVNEVLYLEPAEITDSDLVAQVLVEMAELERGLQVFLEPTLVVSHKLVDPLIPYDVVGNAVAYYPPRDRLRWMNLQLPYRAILKVKELSGWLNEQKALTVNDDWRVESFLDGGVELVPSNAAVLTWQYLGLTLQTILYTNTHIPSFWQYYILAGLREMPPELRHFIGKRAAIHILGLAGTMRYPGGVTSMAISRDGVSESRGLNPRGVYAALIDQYRRDTGQDDKGGETLVPRLRQRYGGLSLAIM